jgi:transposase
VSSSRPTHRSRARVRQPRRRQGQATERYETTLAALHGLRKRIDEGCIEREDLPLLGALVQEKIQQTESRNERQHQRMLAKLARSDTGGVSSRGDEEPDRPSGTDGGTGEEAESGGARSGPEANASNGELESANDDAAAGAGGDAGESDKKAKGHGRNGASAYTRARHFFHTLAKGVVGSECENCRCGKMHPYRVKITIHVSGQPLFDAALDHHEQARCRECGHIIRASGPEREGLGSDYIRYDWSACAMLMVMHYFAGAPFKRLESLHAGWGIPLPDANQWEVVSAADDLLLPLYRALERHAVQRATAFRVDDTGSMVISLKKEIEAEIAALERLGKSAKDVRTGINATGFYWETAEGPIILFYTGRHHAGEMVDELLRHRQLSNPRLIKSTDGASKNFDHEQAEKVIESTCNAHALLKFRDLKDKHPIEYAEVASLYKQVFDNDDQAGALGLRPDERMLHHRQHSKPLMEKLKKLCEEKLKSKLVEPNSPLWQPLTFIVNQWERLTRFYEVPGVPLDTNLVEQALIIPVRYLAGSFNYQTADGALVGDRAMSLIATARANGIEPVAYLTECLRCHVDLAARPEYYLPWVYRERARAPEASETAERAPTEALSA